MGLHPKWTLEDDDVLRARYGKYSTAELAMHFNRSMDAIKQRAMDLGITFHAAAADGDDGSTDARYGDHAFIKAMARAIRTGLERPPRVGIDTRPGTKSPVFVERGQALVIRSSYMGDM